MPSQSPSTLRPAKKPVSRGPSSLNSNTGSAKLADAALSAADRAFGGQPLLPLDKSSTGSDASLDGRRRLGGAFLIATNRIRPDPQQPRRRINSEAQRELNDSVKRLGILQPITVRYVEHDNIYQVITGERRYLATKEAGLQDIPCWIQKPKEADILLHQIVENWQRLDMHPYDLADGVGRLRDANGLAQKQIAEATGKSEGEISKLLALLDLAPEVQKLAREDDSGRISKRHLYAVRSLPFPDQQAIIERVREHALSAEDTEKIVARTIERTRGVGRRGSPVSHHRFTTSHATVSVTFRKKDVTAADICAALDEARAQVALPHTEGDTVVHT